MISREVANHYTRSGVDESVRAALQAAGLETTALTPEDLAPLDEFHTGGSRATRELIELAGFGADHHVLDIGCGIGGPARQLARTLGCRVTGVDLTPAYCEIARFLTSRTGFDRQVQFRQGDATELPFDDDSFDGAWTQHVTMNLPDKDRLFAEVARVLRPGGIFVQYEIIQGSGEPLTYPVPWARSPETSFVGTEEELRRGARRAGFRETFWQDTTDQAEAFFVGILEKMDKAGPPPLGLHILMGPDMGTMAKNLLENIQRGRVRVVRARFVLD